MPSLAASPAFAAYAVSVIVLCLNLLVLWAYSGAVRGKTKTTPNTEDATTIAKGTTVVETEPPEVARVLRAYANANANIVPFVLLGLIYVLSGASPSAAPWIFGVFTVARLAHSFAYLGAKQPWRTLSYALGGVATLALIGFIAKALCFSCVS